jgi:hypothetical protein
VLGWQRRAGRCFAELIDFAEHVDGAERAALEAALEASGLLAAEVRRDGTLRLADGQLVIAPGAGDVPAPLSTLLRPDIPDDDINAEMRHTVERVLRAISTDLTADTQTIVTIDGEFRLGARAGGADKNLDYLEVVHVLVRRQDPRGRALHQAGQAREGDHSAIGLSDVCRRISLGHVEDVIVADGAPAKSRLEIVWRVTPSRGAGTGRTGPAAPALE